jgi:hypothetical protein
MACLDVWIFEAIFPMRRIVGLARADDGRITNLTYIAYLAEPAAKCPNSADSAVDVLVSARQIGALQMCAPFTLPIPRAS